MKWRLLLGAATVGLSFVGQASAAYILGCTGGTGTANELVLGLSSGGIRMLSTGQDLIGQGLNQGWWSDSQPVSQDNDNYFVGDLGNSRLNNFFTFKVSDVARGSIVSATLRIHETGCGQGFPVTYSLFDVSTDATTLNLNDGINAAILNDLGSGASYGSVSLANNPTGPFEISLTSAAIADIEDSIGQYFSIGGTLAPAQSVPEPLSASLIGLGLAGIVWSQRRRRDE